VKGGGMRLRYKIQLGIAAVVLIAAGLWVYSWLIERPVVSVDYIAKFNETRRPEGYNPDDDGAEFYFKACEGMRGVNMPWSRNSKAGAPWVGDMNEADVKAMRKLLADNASSFALVDEALSRKYCWIKLTSKSGNLMVAMMPDLGGVKELSYGLVWRGELKALDGNTAGGIRDVMAAAEFDALPARRGCCSVEWLVGIATMNISESAALKIAAHCRIEDNELEKLASDIELLSPLYETDEVALDAESLAFDDTVQRVFSDDGHGDGHLLPSAWAFQFAEGQPAEVCPQNRRAFRDWVTGASIALQTEGRRATLARSKKVFAEVKELSRIQPWQMAERTDDPWGKLEKEAARNLVISILFSGYRKMSDLGHVHNATVEGTLGAIGILRYQKNKGALPGGWEPVVAAGYLKEVPIDRFSGKPIVYKRTGDTFTVYSVGRNGVDDGGDANDRKDIVIWPVAGK
jgi:hypothetical protein